MLGSSAILQHATHVTYFPRPLPGHVAPLYFQFMALRQKLIDEIQPTKAYQRRGKSHSEVETISEADEK